MKMNLAIAVALSALVGACATLPPPISGEQITISRGPCFGFCPVYEIQTIGDREVSFEGIRHTAFVGSKRDAVAPGAIAAVSAQLAPYRPAAGVNAFKCEQAVSDQATITVRWQKPGSAPVSLSFDGGCRSADGGRLRSILEAIPAQLGMADEAAQITRPGASRG